jgi:Protein of unknown function (DUF992)
MFRFMLAAISVASVALFANTAVAQEQRRIEVGTLRCTMGPSIGALVASRQRLRCRFTAAGGRVENYTGRITRLASISGSPPAA